MAFGWKRIGELHVRVLPGVVQVALEPLRVLVGRIALGDAVARTLRTWSLHPFLRHLLGS